MYDRPLKIMSNLHQGLKITLEGTRKGYVEMDRPKSQHQSINGGSCVFGHVTSSIKLMAFSKGQKHCSSKFDFYIFYESVVVGRLFLRIFPCHVNNRITTIAFVRRIKK